MRRELIFLDMPHFVFSDDSFDINQVTLDAYASDIEQARPERARLYQNRADNRLAQSS